MRRSALLVLALPLLTSPLVAQRIPPEAFSSVGAWLYLPAVGGLEVADFDGWWTGGYGGTYEADDPSLNLTGPDYWWVHLGRLRAGTEGAWGSEVRTTALASLSLVNSTSAPLTLDLIWDVNFLLSAAGGPRAWSQSFFQMFVNGGPPVFVSDVVLRNDDPYSPIDTWDGDSGRYTLVLAGNSTARLDLEASAIAGISSAPEPASMALLGTGLMGLGAARRRRRRERAG